MRSLGHVARQSHRGAGKKNVPDVSISVADPGCLCLSRIPDPKQQPKRGVKKKVAILFLERVDADGISDDILYRLQ
jgi:hypothetical protein